MLGLGFEFIDPDMELQCLLMTVPIDRDDPSAGTTDISVVVRSGSGGESLPPLAVLQGGPGGASSDLALLMPTTPNPQVFIDQRGTGFGSTDFSCEEYGDVLIDVLEASADRAEALQVEALRSCSERLADDPVIPHTTTANHAADVIDVMDALGHDQWLVYGVSYGTTIALEVMRNPPATLLGAVLDGVYPPGLDLDVDSAQAAQRVIDELDRACADDRECAAILADAGTSTRRRRTPASLSAMLSEVIESVNESPMVVTLAARDTSLGEEIDVRFDGDSVAYVVFEMMYSDYLVSLIPAVVAGLAGGDAYAELLLTSIGAEFAVESVLYGALGTNFAVTCSERLPFTSGPPEGMGDFAAAVTGEGLADSCEPWSAQPAPLRSDEPVRSDLPVLMVSGWFDPVTPPTFADLTLEHLPGATHVVSYVPGHGMWGWDSCVNGIVADFLANPAADLDNPCTTDRPSLEWLPLG